MAQAGEGKLVEPIYFLASRQVHHARKSFADRHGSVRYFYSLAYGRFRRPKQRNAPVDACPILPWSELFGAALSKACLTAGEIRK